MSKNNARMIFRAVAMELLAAGVLCTSSPAQITASESAFPDTETLIPRVAQHQKQIETLLNQYTFTDKDTLSMLDRKGAIRSQHSDTYYVTPTPYEVFALHVNRDGTTVTQHDLERQEKVIESKLRNDERQAQKSPDLHPKATLLFADIILRSQFKPLRWEDVNGISTVVYAFEPKAKPSHRGDMDAKISGDMRGTMWVLPQEAEIVRMEFSSVSPVGLNWLTNVKNFEGFVEQRKVNGEVWLPSHQEFTAQGRELIVGFRIRRVSQFSDYLKATTDAFQQVHAPQAEATEGTKIQPR